MTRNIDVMGAAATFSREQNVRALGDAIIQKKVRTVRSAMSFTGCTRQTVYSYLKQLDMSIIDTDRLVMTPTGSREFLFD